MEKVTINPKAACFAASTACTAMAFRVRSCCALSITFACLLSSVSANAGKLDNIDDTVDGDDDDDDSDGLSFCLFCFLGNEDDEDASYEYNTGPGVAQDSTFLRYPYARGSDGYAVVQKRYFEMVKDPETGAYERKIVRKKMVPADLTLQDGRNAAFMTRLGYWYDLDNVHLSDVRLGVDAADMAGVQFRWTEFYEKVSAEETTVAGVDGSLEGDTLETTALIDVMARVPVVTEHRGLFRLGVAGLLMHHEDSTNVGGFLAAEVILFPLQPLILGVELHVGYISKAAFVRGEATIGAIMGPLELFGGYQTQLFLGEHQSVVSHGPGGGVRVWF